MKKNANSIAAILTILSLSVALNYLSTTHSKPNIKISKQNSAINLDENFISIFSLEYRRMISAVLWVTTLIESDIERYSGRDLGSWLHLRFKTISKIDPLFYHNYRFGGQYLSIVKDDIIGARNIFKLGLENFPSDFWLNFHNAFNSHFELGDTEEAVRSYEKIAFTDSAKMHAPYLPSLLARIKAEKYGVSEDVFNVMVQASKMRSNTKSEITIHTESLYSIRAELDLRCLNSDGKDCNKTDYEGRQYIRNDSGKYVAQRDWTHFRIRKRPPKREP